MESAGPHNQSQPNTFINTPATSACETLRQFLLFHLAQDIAAHEAGRFYEIGRAEDNLPYDLYDQCEREDDDERTRIGIAVTFWDNWADARNHAWGYYRGVDEGDWPIIARQICQGLEERWEPDRMRDNFVFNPPPKPPRVSLWKRIKLLFS
jgi:hypothetical protein